MPRRFLGVTMAAINQKVLAEVCCRESKDADSKTSWLCLNVVIRCERTRIRIKIIKPCSALTGSLSYLAFLRSSFSDSG